MHLRPPLLMQVKATGRHLAQRVLAMPVVNAEIASQLDKVADLLDIEGANPFRVRAYRRAARLVGELPRNVGDMLAEGTLLDELEREVPAGTTALLALPGLGPKRVHLLHETLGIDTIDKLAAAAKAGKLRDVPGIGPSIEASVLRAIAA